MEGWCFFDLVRWGDAEEVLNAYLDEEKTKHDYFSHAHFAVGKDECFPIPQKEIEFHPWVVQTKPRILKKLITQPKIN